MVLVYKILSFDGGVVADFLEPFIPIFRNRTDSFDRSINDFSKRKLLSRGCGIQTAPLVITNFSKDQCSRMILKYVIYLVSKSNHIN